MPSMEQMRTASVQMRARPAIIPGSPPSQRQGQVLRGTERNAGTVDNVGTPVFIQVTDFLRPVAALMDINEPVSKLK